jgi:hypothetical protein
MELSCIITLARLFVTGKLSLIFAVKARGQALEWQAFSTKFQARLAKDKNSSLFVQIFSDEEMKVFCR